MELFSNSVSQSFIFVFGSQAEGQSKVVSIVDSWIDVMNSRMKYDFRKENRCGLGLNIEKQMKSLDDMQELCKYMYFRGKNGGLHKKPFQSGILTSIKSTKALFFELKDEGVEYILTTRVNQDCLESFISCVRGINGPNSHPSPVEAIDRIRKLSVTKNVDFVLDNSNVEQHDQGMNNFFNIR